MVMVKEAQAKYLTTDKEEQAVLEKGACPDGYKLTEVGVIPKDWNDQQLRDYVDITSGESPSKFKFIGEGIPYFKVDQLNLSSKYVEKTPYLFESGKTVKAGSIIFPKRGASILLNKIRILKHDSFMDTNLMTLTVKNGLLNQYLYYFLDYRGLSEVADTTSIPQINNKHINPFRVPVPANKKEQTAIAKALSDVDALISSLEKLIAKKQAIKTATMQQLLTGKKRLPGFGEGKGYKQTELGEIPEDWEVDRIGNILSITTGDKNTQDRIDEGNYPFYVRSQAVERINSYSFDGEAVLTAGDGVGTGKIFHYIQGKFDFHQRVYLMSNFNERIDGFYFFKYFSNHFYDRIMSMTAKSSVDSVRREMIADMLIALPLIDEQREIAKVLSEMDSEIHLLENRLTKTQQIKQGMMQELLTGKTRLVETKARDKYDR